MVNNQRMKYQKIEIIISNSFLQELIKKMEKVGVHGYTALEIFRGKGVKRGEQLAEGLLPTTRSSLVFTIASESLTQKIIDELQPYLEERGGVIYTYDVNYVSGHS
jgi:nitrogen regulatory protein PII